MASKHVTALRKAIKEALQMDAKEYTVHERAPVFPNQLLVSDLQGRQHIISINAVRIPRVALTK